MANPGPYPQMGPPMGGPMQPMGPPMGPMGMQQRRPVRQGTSRVVPVVVSAGLAMGVFCGLLFGLGTGKRSASAEPPKSNGVKRVDDSYTPESMANPNVKIPDKNAPKAGSNAGVAATTGSGSAATTGSGSAATAAAGSAAGSAEPAIKPTKLIVEIKPEAAAATAKVFVDGKPIEGTTTDITPDPGTTKKKVTVLVKAPSYKDVEQEIEIEGDSTTLKLEFTKTGRATGQAATEGGTGATAGSSGTTATSGTSGGTTGASGGAAGHSGGSTGTGGTSGNSGNTGGGGNGGAGNGGGGNGGGKATGGGKGSGGKGKGKGSGGLIDI